MPLIEHPPPPSAPGTSVDTFLRENLEWLSRATNWAKFSATAGLGVIHRGQLQQGERPAAVQPAPLSPFAREAAAARPPRSPGAQPAPLTLLSRSSNHPLVPPPPRARRQGAARALPAPRRRRRLALL
jgi:hypothetical protein